MTDWQTKKLGDIATIKRGGSPRPIQDYLVKSNDDGYNWLKIGDVPAGSRYIYKTSERIKPEGLKKTTLVKKGEFILSNSMSFGRPYIMMTNACIHDGWLALQNIDETIDKQFLYYLLTSELIQNKFKNYSAGSGVQNLKKETVQNIDFDAPEKPEQERIVGVLETWDEYIEKLERKIELKEQLKKGLMQHLLTSPDDWQTAPLSEMTSLLKDGTHGTHKDVEAGPALLSAKDIKNGKISIDANSRKISVKDFGQIHRTYSLKTGDILLTIVGTLGRVAQIKQYHNNFTLQRSVAILRFSEHINSRFMYYLLSAGDFKKELLKRESKGAQGGVYLGEIGKIKIHFPDKATQTKIANTLDIMSDEISLLEQMLHNIRRQKKYLLKNLITGTIRTPENLKPYEVE